MANPIEMISGLFGLKHASTPTVVPAAAPQAPATAPSAGGKQTFLANAAAAPREQNVGSKTLLGQ